MVRLFQYIYSNSKHRQDNIRPSWEDFHQICKVKSVRYNCKESDRARTPRVNEIVRLSSEMSTILVGKKKGQDGLKTILSHSVPSPRIELGSRD